MAYSFNGTDWVTMNATIAVSRLHLANTLNCSADSAASTVFQDVNGRQHATVDIVGELTAMLDMQGSSEVSDLFNGGKSDQLKRRLRYSTHYCTDCVRQVTNYTA